MKSQQNEEGRGRVHGVEGSLRGPYGAQSKPWLGYPYLLRGQVG